LHTNFTLITFNPILDYANDDFDNTAPVVPRGAKKGNFLIFVQLLNRMV